MNRDSASHKADYQLYEKTANDYDRLRFTGRSGEWGHHRQVAILKDLTPDWRGKTVLEMGCGTGRITAALASWGAEITATDISREMLDVARTRFREEGALPTPEFRLMSVFDIEADLKDYDCVIMVNVLGRLSDPEQVIQDVASRISQDCRFVFTFPCLTSILLPFGLMVNVRGKSLGRDVTSHWYTPGKVEELCKNAGLEIAQWRGNHYVPIPRLLFWTLPAFWACDKVLSKSFPKRCPSVFVECRRR